MPLTTGSKREEQLALVRELLEMGPHLVVEILRDEYDSAEMETALSELLTPKEFESVTQRIQTAVLAVLAERLPELPQTHLCREAPVSYATYVHGKRVWSRESPLIVRLLRLLEEAPEFRELMEGQ